MKAAVVYSTLTGNTKKVAEAVLEGLGDGAEIFDVNAAPDPSEYDLVAVGFWVDRGHPDAKAMEYMKKVTGKKVFSFFTLRAKTASAHAYKCAYTASSFYGEGCEELTSENGRKGQLSRPFNPRKLPDTELRRGKSVRVSRASSRWSISCG